MQISDINEIADWLIDKKISHVDVVYNEDTMVMYFTDGTSLELIVDSIYADMEDYDS